MEKDFMRNDNVDRRNFKESEICLDRIRGCMFGGAVGDALGYPIEFFGENKIFSHYGEKGIQEYEVDPVSEKALISDDTQMTLFTANGILIADTISSMRGSRCLPHEYIPMSYQNWLCTQRMSFEQSRKQQGRGRKPGISWLSDISELYSRRAPGNTCMSALYQQENIKELPDSFIAHPQNNSKGCGGIMRVAPLALKNYPGIEIKDLDCEGAEIAAITHGNSLGYMPAAVLVHIIHRIVYPIRHQTLKEIVLEAKNTVNEIFVGDRNLKKLTDIIDFAVELSKNKKSDLDNIHQIGEGWVAEETLGIAIYCSLKYQNDFSAGVIAAVNHRGDSDSTGAVTGNILGVLLGFHAIDEKWKNHLELAHIILEMADDLCHGCQMNEYSHYKDSDWIRKYMQMRW